MQNFDDLHELNELVHLHEYNPIPQRPKSMKTGAWTTYTDIIDYSYTLGFLYASAQTMAKQWMRGKSQINAHINELQNEWNLIATIKIPNGRFTTNKKTGKREPQFRRIIMPIDHYGLWNKNTREQVINNLKAVIPEDQHERVIRWVNSVLNRKGKKSGRRVQVRKTKVQKTKVQKRERVRTGLAVLQTSREALPRPSETKEDYTQRLYELGATDDEIERYTAHM